MAKMRCDFVTNSSSSGYLVVYEIDDSPELRDFIKEEFGRWGVELTNEHFSKGLDDELIEFIEYYLGSREAERVKEVICEDKTYVAGSKIAYTTEGESDDRIITLVEMLPSKYRKLIYEGEAK